MATVVVMTSYYSQPYKAKFYSVISAKGFFYRIGVHVTMDHWIHEARERARHSKKRSREE